MKCTKCGAECDSRQLFCLRCGTPLSNNKSEEESIREVEVPIEDMVNVISLDEEDDDIDLIIERDLSRVRNMNNTSLNKPGDNYDSNNSMYSSVSSGASKNSSYGVNPQVRKEESKANKNDDSKKKMFIIIGIAAAILLTIAIAILITIGNSKKYDEYYQNGMNLYNKGRVQASITQFNKAAGVAKADEDKIEANVMLWKSYSQLDGYDNNLAKVLKELISLEPDNISYYEALIIVYQGMGNQVAIDELIASVTDTNMQASLADFDGTTPVATISEGEYNKPISVGLAAISGSKIYYTVNGGNATTSSNVYSTSIDFDKEGEYVIKAIAVDSKGEKSRQFVGKYVLKFKDINPPQINLDSGTYNERKKIKITADAGCTVYYTNDESEPTEKSKKYEKSFKMPEKNTVYKFIAIDENGIKSDIVTRVYRYEVVNEYDYDKAVAALSDILISKGIMENSFGTYEDGSVMYFEYVSLEEIEEVRYYIIKATKESEVGTVEYTETFAFGCDTGTSHRAVNSDGKYTLKKIK